MSICFPIWSYHVLNKYCLTQPNLLVNVEMFPNISPDDNPSIDNVNIQRETTDNPDLYNTEPYQSHGMCGTPGGIYLLLAER